MTHSRLRHWVRILTSVWSPPWSWSWRTYWKQRARQYGVRAVFNLQHAANDLDRVTLEQKQILYPHFQHQLTGKERIVLDFGCGPGRFSGDLAEMTGGRTIAIDPVQEFLGLAPEHRAVDYKPYNGRRLALANDSVDVVWICLVLGGISKAALPRTVRDILRVLRPGGLIFLVENTSPRPSPKHWTFRSTEEYCRLFLPVGLRHLGGYEDLGENISIMAGRKP